MLGLHCQTAQTTMKPVLAPFQPKVIRFPYDWASHEADKYGLAVTSTCHADIPRGTPLKDGRGNYMKARTVYIGKPGAAAYNCAYARCFSTIHQIAEPGMAEALSAIATHLMYWDTFEGSRANYEEYYNTPHRLPAYMQDQLAEAWRDHANMAQRAILRLPAGLIEWLRSTYKEG